MTESTGQPAETIIAELGTMNRHNHTLLRGQLIQRGDACRLSLALTLEWRPDRDPPERPFTPRRILTLRADRFGRLSKMLEAGIAESRAHHLTRKDREGRIASLPSSSAGPEGPHKDHSARPRSPTPRN